MPQIIKEICIAYTQEELFSIFMAFCKPYKMTLSEEAEGNLKAYLTWLVDNKDENFANGREMRNLFEAALSNQANRLADQPEISDTELNTLDTADLPEWVIGIERDRIRNLPR